MKTKRQITPEMLTEIKSLYVSGCALSDIASIHGTSISMVRRRLMESGVTLRTKAEGLLLAREKGLIRYARCSNVRPLTERFWKRVKKTETCWLWVGSTRTPGYGIISEQGVTLAAHRLSWEINRGPIPPGIFVLHKCDVPLCVNPDHLFLGTQADNMQDMDIKGRRVMPHHHRRKVAQ